MKNRTRETCTSGTVRDEAGNILIYSANDRGDRGNVDIIRSPIGASILPDRNVRDLDRAVNSRLRLLQKSRQGSRLLPDGHHSLRSRCVVANI